MAKVSLRIDTIELACSDKTIQHGSAFTAVVAAEEDKILFPRTDGTKGSFGCVVIRLCKTVIAAVAQRILLLQRIRERLARPGFFRQRCVFSTNQSCRDISCGLLCDCLAASRSVAGRPRMASSIAYSSPIRFSASSVVA